MWPRALPCRATRRHNGNWSPHRPLAETRVRLHARRAWHQVAPSKGAMKSKCNPLSLRTRGERARVRGVLRTLKCAPHPTSPHEYMGRGEKLLERQSHTGSHGQRPWFHAGMTKPETRMKPEIRMSHDRARAMGHSGF